MRIPRKLLAGASFGGVTLLVMLAGLPTPERALERRTQLELDRDALAFCVADAARVVEMEGAKLDEARQAFRNASAGTRSGRAEELERQFERHGEASEQLAKIESRRISNDRQLLWLGWIAAPEGTGEAGKQSR